MPRPDFSNHEDMIEEIIRVNHAGEYGAQRIYEGQLRFTKGDECRVIKEMLYQEQVHLNYFTTELLTRNTRPTYLLFLWHKIGYTLGTASALLGKKASMLLTQAIEEVIEGHYQKQINYLEKENIEVLLLENIRQFQLDEIAHKDIAIAHESEKTFMAPLIGKAIRTLCKLAINLSKKI